MSISRIDFIAQQLRKMVEASTDARMPSRAALASQLKTSMSTLQQAMVRLEREGLVMTKPRGGAYIARLVANPPAPAPKIRKRTSASAAYEALVRDIEQGVIKKGAELPKVAALARRLGLGYRSVLDAYARLAKEGLVYRYGRSYVFGDWESRSALAPASRGSAILVFQIKEGRWVNMAANERLRGFFYAFTQEVINYNIRVIPVAALQPHKSMLSIPTGKEQIRQCIERLGNRLLGVLAIGEPLSGEQWRSNFQPWLEWFCSLGQKTIWFDVNGSASAYDNPGPITSGFVAMMSRPEIRKHLTRVHYDEQSGVRCAIEALMQYKHCIAAMPNPIPRYREWATYRKRLIDQWCELNDCAFKVSIEHAQSERSVDQIMTALSSYTLSAHRMSRSIAGGVLAELADDRASRSQLPHRTMLAETGAVLCKLVEEKQPSAILAPNDHIGRYCQSCLQLGGIAVPQEMSVISFDANPVRMYPYSLSSVDFGFDYLGYQALHQFLGDRRVRLQKHRSLPSLCRLTHLETIGAARTRVPVNQ